MRAVTFRAPRDLALATVPDPALERPTDAVVRVELAAICGSDLHVYRGHERGLDRGTVMGHEFTGEVVEVGPEVERWRPGDRVVAPFSTSCGACFFCRRGLTSRCEHPEGGQVFGWVEGAHGLHGAQAEYVRVPLADAGLVARPPEIPAEQALLAGDILSTALFCAENGGVDPQTAVAVVGCGPVGLLSIQAARRLGAALVFAVDSVAERLDLARCFGARPAPLAEDPLQRVREATEGRGADVVLEAVGSAEATRLAFELVRPGGTISAAGVHHEPQFAFSPGAAYDKNLTYRAGRAPARAYMEAVLELLARGEAEVRSILTHRVALADTVQAYETFDRKLAGCIKVLVEP